MMRGCPHWSRADESSLLEEYCRELRHKVRMIPLETLKHVIRKEVTQRDENRVRLAQMSTRFPFMATMDGFDMSFQPSIDPGKVRDPISLG